MSQTINQYITSLLGKYTPSTTAFDAARTHRAGIERRLDAWLGLHEIFETGSLRHGTGVAGYSDADLFASLKGVRPAPTTALNKVKEALQDKYPYTTIQIRRPAVVCLFANGAETVEVVPAFPADNGYWIPDPRSATEWMRAHPKDHNNYVSSANSNFSGAAKKLARLAKTWKYKRSVPVSSCYLEMRAAKYINDQSSVDLALDIYYFLNRLKVIELASMNDPTGLNSRFNAYSSETHKADALSKLATAVTRAEKAKESYLKGDSAAGIDQLKLLFNQ
ncbi:hypothetical protein [Micromonospora echinospora]|uniref:SMODS domain-containing nucleotidyltransferase n=1 Tax=Micromonospora echinospora TaxID=1877 RepID=UPI003672D0B4